MSLNPFKTISSYSEMLNKLAVMFFFECLLLLVVLRVIIQKFDSDINSTIGFINFTISINGNTVSFGNLLIAIVLAIASRITKLHDRISDFFKIRHSFDVNIILYPLATMFLKKNGLSFKNKIVANRSSLMSKVFYKYASSDKEKRKIDNHDVEMALDQWSWYWFLLELSFLIFISTILSLLYSKLLLAVICLFIFTLLLFLMSILKRKSEEYALIEVEKILDDASRYKEVEEVFNALHD